LNKSDLQTFAASNIDDLNLDGFMSISAKTGAGLDAFRVALLEPFLANNVQEASFLITNARHYDLLRRTADSLRSAKELLEKRVSEDLLLVGLYDALRYLGEITGETTPENVLSQIFATFCIGK
jgi:tRNA modification GTPase